MASGVEPSPVLRGRSQSQWKQQEAACRDRMDRKEKYGVGGEGRKETVIKKANQLCTLTGNRVFAGVVDGKGNTVWPPVDYRQHICSYRLRRDIRSYQLSKEPKRKMPSDFKKHDGVSTTFAPLSLGLLQNCEDDLLRKIQHVRDIINTVNHDTCLFDACGDEIIVHHQRIPAPGPALLDYSAKRTTEYWEALNAYAYDSGMDASEAHSEFDYVSGWCFLAPAL